MKILKSGRGASGKDLFSSSDSGKRSSQNSSDGEAKKPSNQTTEKTSKGQQPKSKGKKSGKQTKYSIFDDKSVFKDYDSDGLSIDGSEKEKTATKFEVNTTLMNKLFL